MYVEIPLLEKYHRKNWKEYLPIGLALFISWAKYEFDICETPSIYPKGRKEGKHVFKITIGILYWSIAFVVYLPKNL